MLGECQIDLYLGFFSLLMKVMEVATHEAVIFLQSVQWQMKVSTNPSPSVGTSICTAPQ